MSSSETKSNSELQKVYNDEHIRVLVLKKKKSWLQADVEKEKAASQMLQGKLQDELDAFEAELEVKISPFKTFIGLLMMLIGLKAQTMTKRSKSCRQRSSSSKARIRSST